MRYDEADSFEEGQVLVVGVTDPDWEPLMRKACAIVTDLGGRASHAANFARSLGLPAGVGTRVATSKLSMGELVTVVCSECPCGRIYRGLR